MKTKINACNIVVLLLATFGCDCIHEPLTGPYSLSAIDEDEQLCVARESDSGLLTGKIGPVVTDAGWNAQFIVAAVRPAGKKGTPPSYYYLDIAKDFNKGNQYQ